MICSPGASVYLDIFKLLTFVNYERYLKDKESYTCPVVKPLLLATVVKKESLHASLV